jgi:hypothetical protein
MTDSPAVIARKQLYALYKELGDSPTPELRLQIGMLAAQIEIADKLKGIEGSLDAGLTVNTNE